MKFEGNLHRNAAHVKHPYGFWTTQPTSVAHLKAIKYLQEDEEMKEF